MERKNDNMVTPEIFFQKYFIQHDNLIATNEWESSPLNDTNLITFLTSQKPTLPHNNKKHK